MNKPIKSLVHSKHKMLILFVLSFYILGCSEAPIPESENINQASTLIFKPGDTIELKKGDILVRPNLNILPGTSPVNGGKNYGHAAIVVKGFRHWHPDSLLARTIIIESIAKDVPAGFQVREIKALVSNRMESFDNHNFDNRYKGHRYRLRLPLSESAIDSIIHFAQDQKGKLSSWNASKFIPKDPKLNNAPSNLMENETWYCSLLVWQSVFNVTGLDIDHSGGYMAYPNDLINSSYFDSLPDGKGRLRF
jgi:hypothetical protein